MILEIYLLFLILWYFLFGFLNIIFLISRSTEISGDSAWETILENEESHQEVIDTKFFYQIFLKNLYSIWFPMHSHISADYGNNNKYYHWKVNLSLYFCFNTRFCQMSM